MAQNSDLRLRPDGHRGFGGQEKFKIIFMGTPEFAVPILESIISWKLFQSKTGPPLFESLPSTPRLTSSGDLSGTRLEEGAPQSLEWLAEVVSVITQPDKKVGRKQILTPSPVKVLAQKHKIPVLTPGKISEVISEIKKETPDLIVVAAYGQILPKEILEIPKYGCINIHASLLPKLRGPSPISTAILNGDKETGVTLMLMEEKMDTGPILDQNSLNIDQDDTSESLSKKLSKLGAELLIETLPKWINGEVKPTPQNKKKATYTKIIKKEDGKIDWNKPAFEIKRQIRAFYPWPGSYAFWDKRSGIRDKEKLRRIIKILKSDIRSLKSAAYKPKFKPGTVFLISQDELAVQCGQGALIIEELQLEGKQKMTASEFLRGHPDLINSILN